MINKIKENIFQLSFEKFGSCVYILKLSESDKIILIDTSTKENQQELLDNLRELDIKPENIEIILITHSHFDHIGNNDLFLNAKIYSEKNSEEIKKEISKLKVIKAPGHKEDCICFLYEDILFSGDVKFHNGIIGRTDLEGSDPEEMKKSLEKLSKLDYKILCPGHI